MAKPKNRSRLRREARSRPKLNPNHPERRKLGHRWHRQITVDQLQVGDFISYYDRGERWRRVKTITRQRVRTEPVKYRGVVAAKSKSLTRDQIITAWTKRKES